MSLCYLSSPYTHESGLVRSYRFSMSLRGLQWLLGRGVKAFSPVVHTHFLNLPDWGLDHWLDLDEEFLRASSELVVLCLDGWRESKGVVWEVDWALRHGLPVRYMVYSEEDGFDLRDAPGHCEVSWLPSYLTLHEYQLLSGVTAIYPAVGDRTTYPLLGLAGEVGELLNKVKKWWRDGGGALADCTDERRGEVGRELGDILWYVAMVASEFGVLLSDVAMGNLLKLRDRKSRGVLSGSGDNR